MKNDFNIEDIIEEYNDYVFKIVNNIIGTSLSYQDKEEIVSDTFYLLWKYQNNIEDNLKSYLGKIARNCTYERLRHNKINFEFKEEIFISEDFTKQIEYLEIVNNKINKLDSIDQEVFNLYYQKGYKIKEISKILNLKQSAVKVKLHRIRKKIKEDI